MQRVNRVGNKMMAILRLEALRIRTYALGKKVGGKTKLRCTPLNRILKSQGKLNQTGTSWHVRPSKTRFSLHIRSLISLRWRSVGSQGFNVSAE